MRLRMYFVFFLGVFIQLCIYVDGKSQKKWSIDDILRTEVIKFSEISPDGKYVLYQTGKTADGYPAPASGFYTVSIDGEETYSLQISLGIYSIDPKRNLCAWSPDSKWISYLSKDKNGVMQVYGISPAGGDPKQLTSGDRPVSSYSWSSDGKQLLFVTEDPISAERLSYKAEWGDVLSPEELAWSSHRSLWIQRVDNLGNTVKIVEGKVLHGKAEWSPDNKRIAFLCSEDIYDEPELFIANIAERKEPAKIAQSKAGIRFFSWSPDDRGVGYIVAEREQVSYANYHDRPGLLSGSIWFYDLKNNSSARLTDLDYPQLNKFVWSRKGDRLVFIGHAPEASGSGVYTRYIPLNMYVLSLGDKQVRSVARGVEFFLGGEFITWSADDRDIWFTNGEGVGFNVFATDVSSGKVRHVTSGKDFVDQLSFDRTFKTASFVRSSISKKPDVYVTSISMWKPEKVTNVNPWVREFEQEQEEIITYQSEGWDIEALLVKPASFDPNKKYPLIVVTHGGPNWFKLNEWLPDWEQYPLKAYSAEGYLLFFPNFRGSANYGAEFIKTTHHDLGGQDARDVLNGVDFLVARGFVDENRMGICGWSYGGFLTPAIITQTDRFKAAQFGAGLPSIEGMYASLWTVERILYRSFDARPWENGAMHIQYSPLYHAHKVKTPTLIQHGEKDPRCPVGGAVLFYKALKSYDVPAVLEIYPEMGHSITNPVLYKRAITKNLEWFNKWLKGDRTTSFERLFP